MALLLIWIRSDFDIFLYIISKFKFKLNNLWNEKLQIINLIAILVLKITIPNITKNQNIKIIYFNIIINNSTNKNININKNKNHNHNDFINENFMSDVKRNISFNY